MIKMNYIRLYWIKSTFQTVRHSCWAYNQKKIENPWNTTILPYQFAIFVNNDQYNSLFWLLIIFRAGTSYWYYFTVFIENEFNKTVWYIWSLLASVNLIRYLLIRTSVFIIPITTLEINGYIWLITIYSQSFWASNDIILSS